MTNRVFKYPLPPTPGVAEIPMPRGATLLSAGVQGGQLVVWAAVREHAPIEPRRIVVLFTGDAIPDLCGRFISTLTTPNGLVWHVFDGSNP